MYLLLFFIVYLQFALDQLQCLTGNTLSDWQHQVVLSSLLAQKKTQAALQYLHVRKPAPLQNSEISDHDKLEDWQSCCNLYLARGLVFEALDVIRMCVQNSESINDKKYLLNFFYKGKCIHLFLYFFCLFFCISNKLYMIINIENSRNSSYLKKTLNFHFSFIFKF